MLNTSWIERIKCEKVLNFKFFYFFNRASQTKRVSTHCTKYCVHSTRSYLTGNDVHIKVFNRFTFFRDMQSAHNFACSLVALELFTHSAFNVYLIFSLVFTIRRLCKAFLSFSTLWTIFALVFLRFWRDKMPLNIFLSYNFLLHVVMIHLMIFHASSHLCEIK